MPPLPAKEITVTLPVFPRLFPDDTAEDRFTLTRQALRPRDGQ